jgi:hypothetical protein
LSLAHRGYARSPSQQLFAKISEEEVVSTTKPRTASRRKPASKFAFAKARKEPIDDAAHVRNAIARFDQVEDVTDAERDRAWKRILTAAKKFDIEVEAEDWRELFVGGKSKKR